MVYYSEFFVNAARADLLKLRALEESLRDVLTREARLTLQVALRNSGETATVFRQYYAAGLRSKQYSSTFLVTPIDEKTKRPSSNDLLERLARDVANDGKEPEPPASDDLSKILPSARGSHLSGIAAGEVKQLTLQTMRPLGNDGKQIVAVFQDDVIECELYGFLADGSMIASNRVPFGKSATEREQNEVLQRASHRV